MKTILLTIIFTPLLLWLGSQKAYAQGNKNKSIKIDPHSGGRIFLGIGALSAGASSSLLMSYPEPQRSQILDIMFKPKFGASLHTFKVEIGGDVNSTDGTEPSHAHTRQEFLNPKPEYFQRGYEWWLMKEAKKRNSNIDLDCLEWGTPGWIGEGTFYSEDNIDYVISFIKGAKKYHDLTIDYTGIWNERMYDIDYIKNLRKSLDKNDLSNVKIIAADQCCGNEWIIAGDVKKDEDLLSSIDLFGDHYPERSKEKYQSNEFLKKTGKPITNSEGGPWKGTWNGFKYLVKMYNRDYIVGKMTRQITWSLITSYYDNLSLPGSGLMKANTPWSGYFEIQPAIWAAAHTTQFANPGWKYLDDACGFLADSTGSYVTLVSPGSPYDYSVIIETMDASTEQKIEFKLSEELSRRHLNVWLSDYERETFIRQKDIIPRKGKFSINLKPNAVYSITTTRGQQKGNYIPPVNALFPVPYHTDFEEEHIGQLPKYFSDQSGIFEVKMRTDGKGKCMQQVLKQEGIEWSPNGSFVGTIIGDTSWTDYTVNVSANIIENTGSAKLMGRIMETHRGSKAPEGYWFEIFSAGRWTLNAGSTEIRSGRFSFDPFRWHEMSLKLKGNKISVYIDEKEVVTVENSKYNHGLAGLGSGFNFIQFDNFSIGE